MSRAARRGSQRLLTALFSRLLPGRRAVCHRTNGARIPSFRSPYLPQPSTRTWLTVMRFQERLCRVTPAWCSTRPGHRAGGLKKRFPSLTSSRWAVSAEPSYSGFGTIEYKQQGSIITATVHFVNGPPSSTFGVGGLCDRWRGMRGVHDWIDHDGCRRRRHSHRDLRRRHSYELLGRH